MNIKLYSILLFIVSIKLVHPKAQLIQAKATHSIIGFLEDYSFPTKRSKDSKNTPEKRKSEIMCETYAKILSNTVWIQYPTNLDPIAIPFSKCDSNSLGLINELIAGGNNALYGEFPHMVALGYQTPTGVHYLCGGSLISEKWVLTTAHCTHGTFSSPVSVKIGSNHLDNSTSGQTIQVKSVKNHPDYQAPLIYADIALIELSEPAAFGLTVKPACVNPHGRGNSRKLWATGWGGSAYGEEGSGHLLKIELDVISNDDCSKLYNNSNVVPRGIAESMICAGDVTGNWKRDTCPGDSGGPLQYHHPDNCLYVIVGITSSGKFCVIGDQPGIYTRVASFIDWIEEIVWPDL